MRKYLTNHQKLSSCQHGFIKGRSTETALATLTSSLFSTRDSGHYTALAALDLTKAFDTICHKLMINKLRDAGFNNTACSWFQSYLSNRTQSVRYASSIFDPLLMDTGLPQGSNLAPLIFIIYINDLLLSLPSHCTLAYADDTTLIAQSSTEFDATATLQMLVNSNFLVHC